ncbi:MAG TPA: ATP-binding protein [Steroidobacteraceae bacterium]|jgi:signal transduction histidine kinase|nr:ATP-binding protein [Steroidobacteraceae bacterium]
MERLINTLRLRLMSVVLVIHAALVPLLYVGVTAIVTEGYAELFVNPARSYSQLVADELEGRNPLDFERRTPELLDSVLLTGEVVFAEIIDGNRSIHGSLPSLAPPADRRDDFQFGTHEDGVYYISHTIKRPDRSIVLRLGFDESPTLEQIRAAKRRVLIAVLTLTAASIAVALWLSVMRQKLVGTNERLEREMQEREVSEAKRLDLERRLLHRERIATIGTLAGGIAHEFNNIMTPILLYSQVALQDAPAGGALAADLTRIVAAAHRARSLVNGILTFSREMDLQQAAVFALRPTIEEALGLLRAIVPANIEITFEAEPDEVPVVGDPSLLHQVVINLCTNAYQAMSPSGGRIALKLGALRNPPKSQITPGHYVVLEVSDTGHGMDESVLAHIFDPFFTTRDVGEGTGLGLSIVHGIVTSMGGVVTVESIVGTGTLVQIYLPAAAARLDRDTLSAGGAA